MVYGVTTTLSSPEDVGNTLDSVGVVPDAQGEVVRRALGHPAFEERPNVGLEEAAGVRVAGGGIGPCTLSPSAMTNLNLPSAVSPMQSIVIGPSLILNSTPAPRAGLAVVLERGCAAPACRRRC